MSGLSRRNVLRGLAAGVTVVGWSTVDRTWVPAGALSSGSGPSSGFVPLPPLDGELVTAPEALAGFAQDFGHLVTATPNAILRPGSVQDVVTMVRYARRQGLTVAMNGQSGSDGQFESHSSFGQALVPGGIAVDTRSLATIHTVDVAGGRADVDAGVTWAELTDTALEQGLTPPMLPDYLGLSVGGTLSVGGVGGTMQHVGAVVDTVLELQVVTGRGELVTCSPTQRALLFNAVLAGGGQCGIVVRASIRLVPAETHAVVFNLFYDDLAAYVSDQLLVLSDGRFDYQEGQVVARPDGSGWRYMMEVGAYFTPPAAPDRAVLLAGLSDIRADAVVLEPTYAEWVHRVDPGVAALKAGGFWDQPHPWLDLFVPASRAVAFVGSVVAQLTADDLGAGLSLLYPFDTAKLNRPLMVTPRGEPAFSFSLLRFPFPGHPDIPGLVAQNRSFYDEAVALGGKRYLIGAIPDMTAADWRRHYGPRWPLFAAAKQLHDPDNVLTPGQGIFEPRH